MKTLTDIGEKEAIRRICRMILPRRDVAVGPGDDCAVVRPAEITESEFLLTSDPLVAGIHFSPDTPAGSIGHKAIGRALSDIAAMGGKPEWALVNIVAPGRAPVSSIEEIYRGITNLANQYKLAIAGGDFSGGFGLEIHVFAIGSVPAGRAILRSGAKPGDLIYATGSLGGSILGKHLTFQPRVSEGIFLRDYATSMIDLSDGLATDLRHIIEMSRAGAEISEPAIPVSADAAAINDGIPPVEHALHDGEDFELLFTIPPGMREKFENAWKSTFTLPCTNIGNITASTGDIDITDRSGIKTKIITEGFQHFEKH